MTDFRSNNTDAHLQNLLRQVREELVANNPVAAFIKFEVLTKYLSGFDMEGKPWKYAEMTDIELAYHVFRFKDIWECNSKDPAEIDLYNRLAARLYGRFVEVGLITVSKDF